MIQQVYKTLPDDDPILSICVVEDPVKCPPGYYVVNRTHDQDSDADMYRQSVLFGKRNTRYLCLSKIHGIADLVVEAVSITGEKDPPPASYCLIAKTKDTDQKAWRKSQLCYKVAKRSLASSCVTDIILLSRMKKAPEGFQLGGEINGLTLCYKVGTNTFGEIISRPGSKPAVPQLAYSLHPKGTPSSLSSNAPIPAPRRAPAERPPSHINGSGYQNVVLGNDESPHEYEKLVIAPLSPKRPAPHPPSGPLPSRPAPKLPTAMSTYSTLGTYQGLEGIPFTLHKNLQFNSSTPVNVPSLKFKTAYEIELEFNYDFRVERQT